MDEKTAELWPPHFPSAPAGSDPRTLVEIEGVDWGKPTFESHLVVACCGLRHKPLGTFTIEDFRIMIGQKNSLPILVPLALQQLHENLLVEGAFYQGDLLRSVVEAGETFWLPRQELHGQARTIAEHALQRLQHRRQLGQVDATDDEVIEAVRRFLAK